MKPNPKDGLIK